MRLTKRTSFRELLAAAVLLSAGCTTEFSRTFAEAEKTSLRIGSPPRVLLEIHGMT